MIVCRLALQSLVNRLLTPHRLPTSKRPVPASMRSVPA